MPLLDFLFDDVFDAIRGLLLWVFLAGVLGVAAVTVLLGLRHMRRVHAAWQSFADRRGLVLHRRRLGQMHITGTIDETQVRAWAEQRGSRYARRITYIVELTGPKGEPVRQQATGNGPEAFDALLDSMLPEHR